MLAQTVFGLTPAVSSATFSLLYTQQHKTALVRLRFVESGSTGLTHGLLSHLLSQLRFKTFTPFSII